jgi:hypothetical protein
MTPITLRVNVSEVEARRLLQVDFSNCAGDLAGDKSTSSSWRFVVEQDSITSIHIVSFPVVDYDPVTVKFSNAIWRSWVKWSGFFLWSFNNLSIKLTSRSLALNITLFFT